MKIEVVIFSITGLLLYNAYYDNYFSKTIKSYEKYIKMGTIAFVGLSLYLFLKKNPHEKGNFATYATQAIKFMPVDRNSKMYLTPLLHASFGNPEGKRKVSFAPSIETPGEKRMMNSGRNSNKRSVSQAKKKFVAARQKWVCNDCKQVLDATYEVDHIQELQHGGTNHIDNLVALCRNCHGKKTMMNHI